MVGWSLAKKIAVLYESDSQDKPEFLKQLLIHFRNEHKRGTTLAYNHQKKGSETPDKPEIENSFNRKDLTFFMKPKKESLKQFANQEFDILLDLTSHRACKAKHIAAISKAKYKVGAFHKDYRDIYDLLLHVREDCLPMELAKIAIHYLKIIKTKDEYVKQT